MSNAFAIAGVTQVLIELLNAELVRHQLASIVGSALSVTALPLDRVVPQAGGTEGPRLNLFLRLATPNAAFRNEALPARDAAGRGRLANEPLALNLHYIVSAHGGADLHAEILLGHAMFALHENPVVGRQRAREILSPAVPSPGSSPARLALAGSGLEDQIEVLKITPEYLSSEELAKFWTATQSHYRPCAGYVVSVVLVQGTAPRTAPLPVLERRVDVALDIVPSIPTLQSIESLDGQPSATIGTPVRLRGHLLGSGPGRKVVLKNDRLGIEAELDPTASNGQVEIDFTVTDPAAFPAGVYSVFVRLPDGTETRDTNHLALTLAPALTTLPAPVQPVGGVASFAVSFTPEVRPTQTVKLLLGQRECDPQPFTASTGTLSFVVPNAKAGIHQARLRVDGIDSAIIDLSDPQPKFNDRRIEIQ